MFVRLTVDGKRTTRLVHVLVAKKFCGKKPSDKHQVRHLDGNRKNNIASNLAWGTAKENASDRAMHGTTSSGETHSIAVKSGIPNSFSDAEIRSIARLRKSGWSQRKIAERLGRSQSGIRHIIRGL
jgi:DNA-binding NarL/FixJ family response regulator